MRKGAREIDTWLTEDSLFLISCWSRDGMTLGDMAKRMGISPATMTAWRKKYPEFKKATEEGAEITNYRVEDALYKRCIGFSVKETKTIIYPEVDSNGSRKVRIETTEKEILPDVTACLSWLNNKCPDKWKRNRDNFVDPNSDDAKVTINITRHGDKDVQIKANGVTKEDEEWEQEWNSWEDE